MAKYLWLQTLLLSTTSPTLWKCAYIVAAGSPVILLQSILVSLYNYSCMCTCKHNHRVTYRLISMSNLHRLTIVTANPSKFLEALE